MSRPLIGITCDVIPGKRDPRHPGLYLDIRYAEAVRMAGGNPVLIPPNLPLSFPPIQGLLIPGGADIHPKHYGEAVKEGTKVVYENRFLYEREIYLRARDKGVPVLGICYGMQLINVVEGGSLYQDLARDAGAKLEHRALDRIKPHHAVKIEPGSRLRKILGNGHALVHTSHHQGVNRLAPGFCAAALAPDGAVEAIEGPRKNVLAVQWHPERTSKSLASRRLLRAFVRMCR